MSRKWLSMTCAGLAIGIVVLLLIKRYTGPHTIFKGHAETTYSVDIDCDSRLAASAGLDGVRVWTLASGKELFHLPGPCYTVRFLPGHRLLCAVPSQGLVVLDVDSWKEVKRFTRKETWIVAAVSPSGRWVAANFGDTPTAAGETGRSDVLLLDGDDLGVIATIPAEQLPFAHSMEFDRAESELAIAMNGNAYAVVDGLDETMTMSVFRAAPTPRGSLELCRSLPKSAIAFSPAGELYVGSCRRVSEGKDAGKLVRLRAYGKDVDHYVVAVSNDGKRFATGSSHGQIIIWDAKTQTVIEQLSGKADDSDILGLRFSPDSKYLINCGLGRTGWDRTSKQFIRGPDYTIKVWRIP